MPLGNYCDSVPQKLDVKIHNNVLSRLEYYKYVGSYFDSNM